MTSVPPPAGAPTRKVALLRTNFLPYSETFIHDQLRLHQRYAPEVFCRQHRNADRFTGHTVHAVEAVPAQAHPLRSALFGATSLSRRLDAAFDAGRFDIIHAHFGHNALYGLRWSLTRKVPMVVSLHGRDVSLLISRDRYSPRWLHYTAGVHALFRSVRLFLAASQELKDLIEQVGCPPEKVVVHRLGVDVARFVPGPGPDPDAPPSVVMVGRFVEKKGHEDGLRAAARARDAGLDFRLTILGDGDLRPRYEALVAELNLGDRVHLPGPAPHAEVVAAMKAATVVLTPSVVAANQDRESGLIVAKEAAACAVPVVGTLHGGIPEIIDDGVTGYLVPERDPVALGDRLIALLRDPALRARMAAAARAKMLREYDNRERVAALEALYDQVIAGR